MSTLKARTETQLVLNDDTRRRQVRARRARLFSRREARGSARCLYRPRHRRRGVRGMRPRSHAGFGTQALSRRRSQPALHRPEPG
ncbi:conserved hypothetical protein [Cupriavidus taiwanensis]|nr:conserved hypothetical protein [Cupriavidus taiwanensis]